MLGAEDGDGAMLDELIRPADADDGRRDTLVGEVFHDGAAEAVVEDVVFHGADDFAAAGEELNGGGIEGLDPAGVDDGGGVSLFFEFGGGLKGGLAHVAEGDDGDAGSVAEDFGFSDFEELGFLFWDGSGAGSPGVANADGTVVVVDHRPKHVDEFIFVLGLHVDEAGDGTEETDIEQSVVRGAVVPGKSGAVHAEGDVKILQGDVMNDHVIRALHERAVDGEEGLHAADGESAGEEGGVFFGDADVEEAIGMAFGEANKAGAGRHGRSDGGDFCVVVGEVGEALAEKLGISRCGRGDGLAGILVKFSEAVELVGFFESGGVAFALLSKNVEDDRLVLGLEKLERAREESDIVAVDGAVVANAEVFKDDAGGEKIFQADLGFVSQFPGAFSGDPLDELGGFFVKARVGRVGDDAIEVFRDGSDVFRNRPLVVVQDNDEALCGGRDIVERFKTHTTREGGISGDADDVLVSGKAIPCDRHPQCGGEGGARVTGSVAIVLAFATEKEAVQSPVLADGGKAVESSGEQFVDITLVADVKDELVFGCFKNTVESEGKLDNSEIRPEVSPGLRKNTDQFLPDLGGELLEAVLGQLFDVCRRVNRLEQRGVFHGHNSIRRIIRAEVLDRGISFGIAGDDLNALLGGVEAFLAEFDQTNALLVATDQLFEGEISLLHFGNDGVNAIDGGFQRMWWTFGLLTHGFRGS